MYHCVVCSKLHNESDTNGWVFEKGFYIEPGTGARFHLGMCDEEANKEIQDKIPRTFEDDCSNMKTILNFIPINDFYIKEFEGSWANWVS